MPSDRSTVPFTVSDRREIVQRAYVATGVNQNSVLHADAVEKAVDAALRDVVARLREPLATQHGPSGARDGSIWADAIEREFG